jgi:hypothetical protein
MKPIIALTICFFCLSHALWAQNGRFSVGMGLGATYTINSFISTVPIHPSLSAKPVLGVYWLPFVFEYRLSKRLSIQTGYVNPHLASAYFLKKGIESPEKDTQGSKDFSLHTVPLKLYADFFQRKLHTFSATLGLTLNFTNTSSHAPDYVTDLIESGEDFFTKTFVCQPRKGIGAVAGLRWKYQFAEKWHLQTNWDYNVSAYDYGVVNLIYRKDGYLYYNAMEQIGQFFSLHISVHRDFDWGRKKKDKIPAVSSE